MTGAKHLLARQDALANNLANANTTGYRGENVAFRSAPVVGQGAPTRVFAVESTPRADFQPGPITTTGRDLDIAVNGRGWIAVQGADGNEAYTRNGSLRIDENGALQTQNGMPVVGEGGPIAIPPDNRITIAPDGTITATPNQAPLSSASTVGRIKLVDPPENTLVRRADGLFGTTDGVPAELAQNVRLSPGAVEGSNVNVAEQMIAMIAVARQFDMQMKMMQHADTNGRASSQLLNVNG
jgi:flagellar basal-body rod protein FlgF